MIETRFKKTEIGEIPEEWEVKRMKDFATLINGRAYKQEELLNSGKYRVLRVGNFFSNESWYYSNLELNENQYCNKGDLLYAWSCTYGAYLWNNSKTIYHYHIWKIIYKNINKKFLYYLLNNDIEKQRKSSQGSTMSHITKGYMEMHFFSLPISLIEQQRIATALSDIDTLLSTLTKKIEKKKLIKQGAMQQLLTGKKRLVGFTEPWEEKRLGTGLSLKPGFPFNSNNFSNTIGVRLIRNRDLKTDDQIIYFSGSYSHDYIINNGDLLIGMDGDFLPCLWSKGFALLNQRVGKIEIVNPNWNVTFLYYHLIEPLIKKQEGTGATTVKHLSHTGIESFILKLPPSREEQSAIATILSDMDKEIEALEAKRTKYIQVKQGMMQQLLTGKIRLID